MNNETTFTVGFLKKQWTTRWHTMFTQRPNQCWNEELYHTKTGVYTKAITHRIIITVVREDEGGKVRWNALPPPHSINKTGRMIAAEYLFASMVKPLQNGKCNLASLFCTVSTSSSIPKACIHHRAILKSGWNGNFYITEFSFLWI